QLGLSRVESRCDPISPRVQTRLGSPYEAPDPARQNDAAADRAFPDGDVAGIGDGDVARHIEVTLAGVPDAQRDGDGVRADRPYVQARDLGLDLLSWHARQIERGAQLGDRARPEMLGREDDRAH